ncbi:MAG TPA: hypothetical protein VGQ09_07805 [Chitinophagaceae bacterium]|jgi:hypothetical protein|nr:hypothetical protein [Chitinophagaceae bacterium]
MKLRMTISVFFLLLFANCNNSDNQATQNKSENDMDAARNFLEAALKGDYKEASIYMLRDSTNIGYLEATERNYKHMNPDEKRNLRQASLRFFDSNKINDSTTITIFANSYKNDKDTLKIVRENGQWLVDLKYLFEHDMDTTIKPVIINPPHINDSSHKKRTSAGEKGNKTDTIH